MERTEAHLAPNGGLCGSPALLLHWAVADQGKSDDRRWSCAQSPRPGWLAEGLRRGCAIDVFFCGFFHVYGLGRFTGYAMPHPAYLVDPPLLGGWCGRWARSPRRRSGRAPRRWTTSPRTRAARSRRRSVEATLSIAR